MVNSPDNSVRQLPPDEISPKAVIIKAIQLKNSLIRNWKLVVALMIIGGVIGFITDITTRIKHTYTAIITFNLGGGSSGPSGMGELGALASAFGLSGGAPDASIFTGENFLYYSHSRPLVQKTLMKEVVINKKKDLMINHYVKLSGIKEVEWEEDDTLKNIRFVKKLDNQFNKQELSALRQIYDRIKGEFTMYQPDRKSSFIEMRVGMENEELAIQFANNHLETIEQDYRLKQTKKTREMEAVLKARADSLAKLLNSTETRLARSIDQNQQMVVAEGQIQQTRLSRNTSFLQTQYMGALQSLDNLRLTLIKEAPLFTIIEPVSLPLDREKTNPRGLQGGLTIGFLLGIGIALFRETYRSIMRQG